MSLLGLEGPLRVHWGVQTPIRFGQDNHDRTSFVKRIANNARVAKSRSFHNNGLREGLSVPDHAQTGSPDPFRTLRKGGMTSPQVTPQQLLAVKMRRDQFHTIKAKKVSRRSSMNGHFYKPETSDANFTPAFGSVSNVFAASHLKTPDVIRRLLSKFHVENDPSHFSLYLVKQNGEMWALHDDQQPLMERVQLNDLTARIFLMDKPGYINTPNRQSLVVSQCSIEENPEDARNGPLDTMQPVRDGSLDAMRPAKEILDDAAPGDKPGRFSIDSPSNTAREIASVWQPVEKGDLSQEVASFMGLPEAVLQGFLSKFDDDEEKARKGIENRYLDIRKVLEDVMATKQFDEATFL